MRPATIAGAPLRAPGWIARLADVLHALAAWAAREWRARRTAEELHGLSDRQLKDIGLSRDDISRAAYGGRDYSFFRR